MKTNLKDRARKLKSDIPAIFLALKDKETPVSAKNSCGDNYSLCFVANRPDT